MLSSEWLTLYMVQSEVPASITPFEVCFKRDTFILYRALNTHTSKLCLFFVFFFVAKRFFQDE